MKLRENCWTKALAFLLAVAGFTAAAGMGWYQLVNYDASWGEYSGSETGPGDGYTVRYLEQTDCSSLRTLLHYYNTRELGSALGLRYTPELIFEADDSIAYGAHILEVMHDVEKADAQRRIDHPESAGETEE